MRQMQFDKCNVANTMRQMQYDKCNGTNSMWQMQSDKYNVTNAMWQTQFNICNERTQCDKYNTTTLLTSPVLVWPISILPACKQDISW